MTVTTLVSRGHADRTAWTCLGVEAAAAPSPPPGTTASTTSLAQGAVPRSDFRGLTRPVARVARTWAAEMWLACVWVSECVRKKAWLG